MYVCRDRPPFVPSRTSFFLHQAKNWEALREKPEHALIWGTGTGKTLFDLSSSAWSYCEDRIDAVLVIAPNGVHRDTWVGEQIPKHLRVPNIPFVYESKSNCRAQEWRDLQQALEPHPGKLVVLTAYFEAIASKSGYEFLKRFCERYAGRLKITVDESHRIMAPGGLAGTRLEFLRSKYAVQARIMTATPTGNGLENLYGQFRFLGKHILDVATYAEYKAMFVAEAKIPGTDFWRITGYRNVKYLNKRIAPYISVEQKPEGLPPRHWANVHTSLSAEQRKAYDDLVEDYQTELRDGRWVEADLSIVRMKRLQQIVAGHITVPDPDNPKKVREVMELECPRITDCIETVRGAPDKVIVWAEEQFEVERLCREFNKAGLPAETLYGPMSSRERTDAKNRFNEDAAVKVLVANGRTGGEGFQLTGTSNPVGDAIFYSHTWSRLVRTQCEGRNHRPGAWADRVIYHDMLAGGTVDAKIRRRVRLKDDVAQLIADPAGVAALLDPDLDYEETGEDYDLMAGLTG